MKEKTREAVMRPLIFIGLVSLSCSVWNLDAVPVDTLRAPMQAMKKEVWSYLFPVKISSVAVGAVFAVIRQNLMPFGIGVGIFLAIEFFNSVLGDGSAALI